MWEFTSSINNLYVTKAEFLMLKLQKIKGFRQLSYKLIQPPFSRFNAPTWGEISSAVDSNSHCLKHPYPWAQKHRTTILETWELLILWDEINRHCTSVKPCYTANQMYLMMLAVGASFLSYSLINEIPDHTPLAAHLNQPVQRSAEASKIWELPGSHALPLDFEQVCDRNSNQQQQPYGLKGGSLC